MSNRQDQAGCLPALRVNPFQDPRSRHAIQDLREDQLRLGLLVDDLKRALDTLLPVQVATSRQVARIHGMLNWLNWCGCAWTIEMDENP